MPRWIPPKMSIPLVPHAHRHCDISGNPVERVDYRRSERGVVNACNRCRYNIRSAAVGGQDLNLAAVRMLRVDGHEVIPFNRRPANRRIDKHPGSTLREVVAQARFNAPYLTRSQRWLRLNPKLLASPEPYRMVNHDGNLVSYRAERRDDGASPLRHHLRIGASTGSRPAPRPAHGLPAP